MKGAAKLHAVMRILRRIFDVPGDIVEAGVAEGGGVLPLIFVLSCTGQLSKRSVLLFDTWQGLPPATSSVDDGFYVGQFKEPFNEFWKNVEWFREQYTTLRTKMPPEAMDWDEAWQKVVISTGLFGETMPKVFVNRTVAMLMCDGDMYQSTKDCLTSSEPYLKDESWIYQDDFFSFVGCYKAVHEHLTRNGKTVEEYCLHIVAEDGSGELLYNTSVCTPPRSNLKGGICNNKRSEAAYWRHGAGCN